VAEAAIMGANLILYFVVLLLVGGASGYASAIERDSREALSLVLLDAHEYGVLIGQAVFGLSLAALGLLIRRAGFVPRIFGVLVLISAAGYLADSFGVIVSSELDELLSVLVVATALVGEFPFFLWLLIKGVRPVPPADASRPTVLAAESRAE
jgi:hypothetical protein